MAVPPLAVVYLPMLFGTVDQHWPEAPTAYLAAQVEKETCITLTHKKCWSPYAELKIVNKATGQVMENGIGLGQLTVTPRFDNFALAKTWDKSLASWKWENRYDAQMQLRALVIYDRNLHRQVSWAANEHERYAFMFSAYNGGFGGVMKDRTLCRNTPGCDGAKWFGNVEHQSFRSKVAVKGYGQSFYMINRGYVRQIMTEKYKKYEGYKP